MQNSARSLKYLAAGLLAAFCLAFARTGTTEKSMVRAVLLEPGESGWTVGLLYQAPEASADSSEASDGIRFAAAEGDSLARAFYNAEAALPLEANFRLCDYLLLMPDSGWDTLLAYEALVLEQICGRTSAQLAACDFSCADLSEETEESGELLTELLQALKQVRRAAPRLCEAQAAYGLLLPVLAVEEGTPALRDEGLFLTEAGREEWNAQQTALYRLLTGRGETFVFWLGDRLLALRQPLLGLSADGAGGFAVRLDCQAADGAAPAAGDAEVLAALCTGFVQERWAAGQDLLSLGAYAALREGEASAPSPEKTPARSCGQTFRSTDGVPQQLPSKVMVTVVPSLTSLSSRMRALWIRAICLTMARPRPVPPVALLRLLSTR